MTSMLHKWISVDQLHWGQLSANPNPAAIKLLQERQDRQHEIEWDRVCRLNNDEAAELVQGQFSRNPFCVSPDVLFCNPNPKMIDLWWPRFKEKDQLNDLFTMESAVYAAVYGNSNDQIVQWIQDKVASDPRWIYSLNNNQWSALASNQNDNALAIIQDYINQNHEESSMDWNIWYNIGYGLTRNRNPKAVEICKQHPHRMPRFIPELCKNPHPDIVHWLAKHPDWIRWDIFCENTNEDAVTMMEAEMDKLDWFWMCTNPNDRAVTLLTTCYPPRRDPLHLVTALCTNINQRVLEFIRPEAIQLHIEVDLVGYLLGQQSGWYHLSKNPAIFQGYDYTLHTLFGVWDYRPFLKNRMVSSGLAEELMKNRFHPQNMHLWASWGHEHDDDFA